MTQQQAMRELRRRLRLDRVKFGLLYDLSAASIERYESVLPPELLQKFATTAEQHGYSDLQEAFLGIGSHDSQHVVDNARADADVTPQPGREARLVKALLKLLRSDIPEDFKRIPECFLQPWLKPKSLEVKAKSEKERRLA